MPIAGDMAAKFPAAPIANLDRVAKMWQNLCQEQIYQPKIVVSSDEFLKTADDEMAIASGTLGIIYSDLAVIISRYWRQTIPRSRSRNSLDDTHLNPAAASLWAMLLPMDRQH